MLMDLGGLFSGEQYNALLFVAFYFHACLEILHEKVFMFCGMLGNMLSESDTRPSR